MDSHPLPPATPSYRLLIVDDSPEDRTFYRRALHGTEGAAYRFVEASSVEEGLACCTDDPFHCVLLDLNLPDGNGLELLDRLPRSGGRLGVPVVMLTGQGNEAVAVAAMKAGAKDYLPKGVLTADALRRAVGNAVEKGLLEARLEAQHLRLAQANRDLARKNREIQSFYHVVSHELKTPLMVIREFTSILLDGLAGPILDAQREHLGLVRDNCDHMATLVNDLLDFCRLENGQITLHPEAVDVGALVQRVLRNMAPIAESKGITLAAEAAPGLSAVRADPHRLRQVLDNLVVNALKFTPAGGSVRLAVAAEPGPPRRLGVSVVDTGVGIPADQVERVFERFHQVDGGSSGRPHGLGLGLTLCRGLVELHGGEIGVTSAPGKGSTFRFTLPTDT